MTDRRRSKLEYRFEEILKELNVQYQYEVTKIPYTVPASDHKYTVDFTINNDILIETKGYLSDHAERKKYILIKEQHPELSIKFVFVDPNKLCGGTKYSHKDWAIKNGFEWCSIKDKEQIKKWLLPTNS